MPSRVNYIQGLKGLTDEEVTLIREKYGTNIFKLESSRRFRQILWGIVTEPMFVLLTIACLVYFILHKNTEGFMMLAAIFFVSAISLYQEARSTRALKALKQFTEPKVKAIRAGKEVMLDAGDIVPGDIIIIEEGNKVPADAEIIQSNDLSVNESLLSGESLPVEKSEHGKSNQLFQGTTINSGKCIALVTATGNQTQLARLGKFVSTYTATKTLLQKQVTRFVRRLAYFGLIAFLIIFALNYFRTDSFSQALLFGLTLAMAAIPEEIPVAFSSFMALGAYHMSKLGIISRQPQIIENLGAVSVICLDKTGTITEDKMEVNVIYDHNKKILLDVMNDELKDNRVLWYALLASEMQPFDSMEKAIHEACKKYIGPDKKDSMKMIYEYPLEGKPPMMTHVYQFNDTKIAAAKGGVERVLTACHLGQEIKESILVHTKQLAEKGFRVLGVCSAVYDGATLPGSQDEFKWTFEGLISFYDPPRKNVPDVLKRLREAGIKIKLLTGDYAETANNIAAQVGLSDYLKYYTGEEVMQMQEKDLQVAVKTVNIFARMFPEAKLKVIEALKATGEIVAMTGDGVNDGPALKSADIGIAMGKKGTDIARQAADLVITDDNLYKIIEAVSQGRKIYDNIKKAIRYIISIHIPIILTASLPVIFAWKFPNIFTPVHVIFLELIMGPTCSIFFEKEPVEENSMRISPRNRTVDLFRQDELLISIVQGLVITAGVLSLYYFFMSGGHSIEQTRMMVFSTLILSNIFLTFADRSFTENFTRTIRYKNPLTLWLLLISAAFLASIHFIPPVRNFFGLAAIDLNQFLLSCVVAFASVVWFEVYKADLVSKRSWFKGRKYHSAGS